jgi:1,2-diacylglycerol 3-alpha-glucosyltransferase
MPDNLRVAHFTNVYKPVVNGVVTSVSTFRETLSELGHSVFLFAPDASGYEDEDPYVFRYPSVGIPGQNYPLTVPISPSVDWLLPRLKLHILHADHPFLLGRVAAAKSVQLNLPLVFTFHTRYREYSHYVPLLPAVVVREFIDAYMGEYLEKCHLVVAPSRGIARLIEQRYGVEEGIHVIPTGIYLDKWKPRAHPNPYVELGWNAEDRILVSAGRLEEEKNWDTLLAAFVAASQKIERLRLVILGEGNRRGALEAAARKAGVQDSLCLPGSAGPDRFPDFLRHATLFCFASITETQGLVTLEAMASGLAVVAVRATGTEDVVDDGATGRLVENDAGELARAIVELLDNDDLRARMAAAGERKAGDHDALSCAQRMVETYHQAIESNAVGRRLKLKVRPRFPVEAPWPRLFEAT